MANFFCFYITGAYPPDLSFIANARHGGEVSAWWLFDEEYYILSV